jgi:hypothetical protein
MGFNLFCYINPAPDARGFTLTPASQVKTEKSKCELLARFLKLDKVELSKAA